jgi:NADPH-dependent 7-cyano-7-deazaguanine reductase QueF
MMIEVIANAYPSLVTRVRLTYPFAQLCPVSNEPQPGSTITVSYAAGESLLETKALARYLQSFAGENPHGVRDLEETAQLIAQTCADALGVAVDVAASYLLASGSMEVEIHATPRL